MQNLEELEKKRKHYIETYFIETPYFNQVSDEANVDAAIYMMQAEEILLNDKFKKAKEAFYGQRKRLPELHNNRRNNKELLRNTAKRVLAVLGIFS